MDLMGTVVVMLQVAILITGTRDFSLSSNCIALNCIAPNCIAPNCIDCP